MGKVLRCILRLVSRIKAYGDCSDIVGFLCTPGYFICYHYRSCLSVGGWTLSDSFPALSADPVSRDAFAQKCAELVAYHDFDGVDIDWEVSYI